MTSFHDQIEKKLSKNFFKKLEKIYVPARKIDRKKVIQEMYDSISSKTYAPGCPILNLYYDKGCGVMRRVPILTELDYCVYYYCVVSLDPILAKNRIPGTYGGWSMGENSIATSEKDDFSLADLYESVSPMYNTFNRNAYIQQYGEFNTKILDALHACNTSGQGYSAVVKIDIANFYDSIRLDILEDLVRGSAPESQSCIINLLFFFLKNWNKQLNTFHPQSVGLPQELIGDCSRLLSNFYLQSYDDEIYHFCHEHDIKYLRYADDQVFFLPEGYDYRELICEASKALSKLGLNINMGKVKYWGSIEGFSKERGYSMLNILDSGVAPKKQTEEKVNEVSRKFLECDRNQLEKRGLRIVKIIISADINRLKPQLRKGILNTARTEYIDFLDEQQLRILKKSLNRREWASFRKALAESTANSIGNARKYHVYKFARENRVLSLYFLKTLLADK